jgi:[acyl-carrier-protein] S-malonyltransferase
MRPAQDRFNAAVESIEFSDPTIEIVGNVEAAPLSTSTEIASDLQAQLNSRVRWTETIQRMSDSGIQTFYEIGSGSVLTGLLRRILPEAEGFSLSDPESLQAHLS